MIPKHKQANCIQCSSIIWKQYGKTTHLCSRCYHQTRVGTKSSAETRKKLSIMRMGDKNPIWRGDKVSYGALHDWVGRHKYKPGLCENCHIKRPNDLANISQKYKRDLSDWEWLCRKCHMIKDGRLKSLLEVVKSRKRKVFGDKLQCCICKNIKNKELFPVDKNRPDGRGSRCNVCYRDYQIYYRKQHPYPTHHLTIDVSKKPDII